MRAATRAGTTILKLQVARRAPKAAAAVWAARRTNDLLRGAALATAGLIALKAMRRRSQPAGAGGAGAGGSDGGQGSEAAPGSSQQAGGSASGSASGGPTQPEGAEEERFSRTPPHGDPADRMESNEAS